MKLIGVFFLSLLCVLTTMKVWAAESGAQKSTQIDANGFSQQTHDPRYTKLPTYLIEMKDGALLPAELIVPAKTKFRLVVKNIGSKPAEFESNQLRQEKVLFMGANTSLVITPLDVGSYDYYDDFAPAARGKITVKAQD
ncbi:cupredoxin domain-containing protein [Marinomonas pollencensis]|uniref:Cupredoxin-like protein n=1 Tax=Marinomonas pollencensis TaxID=491954 RepID=A0A3E0DUY3_9GAMM|nr:cupredoxin domain-containing protein [Marinomonas pollencensis]REG86675.1 cupredoxin-like protein [Marinomonas pollencensis]